MTGIIDYENSDSGIGSVGYKDESEGGYEFTPIGRSSPESYEFAERDYYRRHAYI